MNRTAIQALPMIDEGMFYRLLEETGTVEIDIARIERYFIPLVSFFKNGTAQAIAYGAIVRSHMDMLAAESVSEIPALVEDLVGPCSGVKINFKTEQ
ncbi:MAG: hypothetical protein HYS18_16695 [Burkholderiales bacterium]|nr:hypothetical protein [Burkholderiales bacterium]